MCTLFTLKLWKQILRVRIHEPRRRERRRNEDEEEGKKIKTNYVIQLSCLTISLSRSLARSLSICLHVRKRRTPWEPNWKNVFFSFLSSIFVEWREFNLISKCLFKFFFKGRLKMSVLWLCVRECLCRRMCSGSLRLAVINVTCVSLIIHINITLRFRFGRAGLGRATAEMKCVVVDVDAIRPIPHIHSSSTFLPHCGIVNCVTMCDHINSYLNRSHIQTHL